MSTATAATERVPAGTWAVDHAHSSATFAVRHAGLSIFRGSFKRLDATLEVGDDGAVLTGAVPVESIDVDDSDIRPHLFSPEFFDAERNPEVRFRSTDLAIAGDEIRLSGDLELAGATQAVVATGTVRGPIEVPGVGEKVALSLEATIDRTEFGMDWQMELPDGSPALANDVSLAVELELNKE
ncbi:MAG TPA: YceI family protein [Solirubrobacterales bacterium]